VRSKSEVIVANARAQLSLPYEYETLLEMPDGTKRLPDFTIRLSNRSPVYWEHLGMLTSPAYRNDWEAKIDWYRDHEILPWGEGGGPAGTLVWSDEEVDGPGIDSEAILELAREILG
jgi:hypothetical protein